MTRRTAILFLPTVLMFGFVGAARAATFTVVPFEFDPGSTNLVAAKWKTGLGCPSGGVVPASSTSTPPASDTGCPTTDSRDKQNEALLLAKEGPSATNAIAGATIQGVNGITLTDLGYDLRKPSNFTDDRGSHCGDSPKFKVVTRDGVTHLLHCNLPPQPTSVAAAGNWIRLRFAPSAAFPPIAPASLVKSIQLLLDDGQDGPEAEPDHFGLAVIDNIDINGTLIGRGPARPEESDQDSGHGSDQNHDMSFSNSASRPETSNASFQDRAQGLTVQSVSAARSISYLGTCVTFVADALLNDDPGYVLTFSACDLSALSTPLLPQIGSYTVAVAGLQGVVYQASGSLTSGIVSIHLP